jgi:hypothetical protein
MSNAVKKKQKKSDLKEKKKSKIRSAVAGAALLVGSALGLGCGDTHYHNVKNYYGNDSGVAADTLKPDAGVEPDTLSPDLSVCAPNVPCLVRKESVTMEVTTSQGTTQFTLMEGESVTVAGQTYSVVSIDETVSADSTCTVSDTNVKLEVKNAAGTSSVTFKEGEGGTVSGVTVKVKEISVELSSLNCSSESFAKGLLNQGESMNMGNVYKLVLEDLEVHGNKAYAIISITDSCGNVLDKEKIGKGETKTIAVSVKKGGPTDKIDVKVTDLAAGYKFGSTWAKFDVGLPCDSSPKQCVADNTPLTCSDTSVAVSGTLNQGEYVMVGPVRIQLDDLISGSPPTAAISIRDSCGNILKQDTIEKGEEKTYIVAGKQIVLTANNVAPGYTFGVKWIDLSVKVPCTPKYWCPSVMGTVKQGESLNLGAYNYQLDDVMLLGGKAYALMSVRDANGNVAAYLKIEEGKSEVFLNTKIAAPTVAMGATFGAKWAKIEVYSSFTKPCGQ